MINSIILVPLSISYIGSENYGVWLTLYSMLSWFGLLDIGLGNGLRNKFAECKASGDLVSIKMYVSTTYFLLGTILFIVACLFIFLNNIIDWQSLLNIRSIDAQTLSKTVVVIFIFFCAQLLVKLISTILIADQKSFMAAAINTISSILTLITVYVLKKTTISSIYYMALMVGMINFIVPLVLSFYYFRTTYKYCTPSFSSINIKQSKGLLTIGMFFFLFQSSALIVVATDNIIISQLFGPNQVTPYNIAIKYFAPMIVFFTILSTPLWSAYTDAYEKKDFNWIKSITQKMIRIWMVLVLVMVPVIIISPYVFQIWVGKDIYIPMWLTFWVGVYTLISLLNQIFSNFINGVSKVRLGFYLTLFTGIINIPLCIFLADYCGLGTIGIIIASSLSLLPDVVLLPIQYHKIVNQTAKGIWNR